MGRVLVVAIEELPDVLAFNAHVAGRSEKDVVLFDQTWNRRRRSMLGETQLLV